MKWGNSKQTAEQRKQRAAKCKQTKLNRYGDSNYNNSDKMKQTKSSWSSDRKSPYQIKLKARVCKNTVLTTQLKRSRAKIKLSNPYLKVWS